MTPTSASRIAALRKALEDIRDGAPVVPRAKQALRVDDRAAEEMDAEAMMHVCPGCYAVNEERCASWCIDAEMEREREEERELHGIYDYEDEHDDDYE